MFWRAFGIPSGRMRWLMLAVVVFMLPTAAAAEPCTIIPPPSRTRPLSGADVDSMPANRIFFTYGGLPPQLVDPSSYRPLYFETLTEWTIRVNKNWTGVYEFAPLTAFRLSQPDSHRGRVYRESACVAAGGGPCDFVVGPQDLNPPSRPEVDGVEVTLHRFAGSSPTDCNEEQLRFDVDVFDARAPTWQLRLLAYMGSTLDELDASREPELMFTPLWEEDDDSEVDAFVGLGGKHDRSGQGFRKGEFCFAITAIDLAGNESDRSDPVCIDTRDASDPRVHYAGCACRGGAGTGGAALLLAVLALVLRRRRTLMSRFRSRA
jgi:MYXO-CTERM domain-containing protein